VLFHVGRGVEEPAVVDWLLATGSRDGGRDAAGGRDGVRPARGRPRYEMAAEAPLCLHHCGFGETGPDPAAVAAGALHPGEDADADDEMVEGLGGGHGAPTGGDGVGVLPARFRRGEPALFARMHHSPAALKGVVADWEAEWSALTLKASMLRSMIDRVQALPVATADLAKAGVSGDELRSLEGTLPPVMSWRDAAAAFPATLAAAGDAAEYRDPALTGSAGYVPLSRRPQAPSPEEVWNALPPARRAGIMAAHPINAAKLQAAATGGAGGGGGGAGV
jgi:hypothetical protein